MRLKRLDLILCIGISYHVHETEQDSCRLQDKKVIVEVQYSDNFESRKSTNFDSRKVINFDSRKIRSLKFMFNF